MNGSIGARAGLVSREAEREERRSGVAPRRWAMAAAAAALFGFGAWQGYGWSSPQASPVAWESGRLVATGPLEAALYDPSLGGREEGPAVGEPFAGPGGHTCRRFAEGPVSGVACRRDGDWRVTAISQD